MTHFTLHLMRHGAPLEEGLLLGRTDMPATKAGLDACYAMVGPLSFGRVVTSPLTRACVAAEQIALTTNVSLTKDARWQEMDFGAWDGMSPDVVRRTSGEALARFYADPDASPPPNGERWSAVTKRVSAALKEMARTDKQLDEGVLVVAHGGSIRAACAVLCGLDYQQSWIVDLPYASVLSLGVHEMSDGSLAGQIIALRRAP